MAQFVALLRLLRRLVAAELRSFSSVGLNNLFFCLLFIMSGDHGPRMAFWSTLLFQGLLLAPLLVTFSVDTQQRLPEQRVATWPLTSSQRIGFSALSFALNPLLLVLFVLYLFWMGPPVALGFVLFGFLVHLLVLLVRRSLPWGKATAQLKLPRIAWATGGIAQQMAHELLQTLDFWAAFFLALTGTLYRALGHAASAEAFPVMAVIVAISMSTVAQRMLDLDEGHASLRYRLLPLSGWKVLLTLDVVFLAIVGLLTSCLSFRAGVTCALVSIVIGRSPSLVRRVGQRKWRFVGGDLRFGIAQVLFGGAAGLGSIRSGLWVMGAALLLYAASLFQGRILWNRHFVARSI